MSTTKRAFQLKFSQFCLAAVLVVFAGQVSAGIIPGDVCSVDHVTAFDGGYVSASSCLGLLDKESGTGGSGPNDSEPFLNNAQSFVDGSPIWSSSGAFGINNWVGLGKHDFDDPPFDFILGTSGDPAIWELDFAVSGDFLIAVKQSTKLGLWHFSGLTGIVDGQFFVDAIFGSGNADGGWSHISIYGGTSGSVPEPGILSLLGLGLLGFGLRRRRLVS